MITAGAITSLMTMFIQLIGKAVHTQTQYVMCKKKSTFWLTMLLSLCLGILYAQPPCSLAVQIATPGVISCQNPSVQLNTTVDPASNDLSISWSGAAQLPGVLNPVVTTPGFYSVFLLDSVTGCWGSDTVEVEQDGSIPVVSIVASDIGCDPLNDPVTLSADVTSGIGNFLYSWSTGETTQSITLIPGDFSAICVTVTSTVVGPIHEGWDDTAETVARHRSSLRLTTHI